MPISPIVLQRRHAELGRIRLGAKRGGNGAPMKLEQFRFTSHSERYIRDLAELYGGTPQPWDNNGVPSWEVYTQATSVPVIAVKGGLSQWMETWSGGGCAHRCDGERGADGDLCDPKDRRHLDAKPTTRLSVMLPELEAIGVWRMESHGWNAAAEIPAVAELAQYVGDLVPANLHLVERRSVKDGKTSRFVVPVLDLQIGTARLKAIVAEKSGAAVLAGPAVGSGPAELEAPAPPADPYAGLRAQVDAATTLPALADIWDQGRAKRLLGEAAPKSDAHVAFVEAWKAKARTLEAAAEPAPQSPDPGPDADGAYDAEVVEDGAPVDAPAVSTAQAPSGPDPDVVWQQILAAAGRHGLSLEALNREFRDQMGVIPDEASGAELQSFLGSLTTGEQVSA